MSRILSPNLEYALGWTVVHSLWQATAIALLIAVLMIALRKRAAQTRYVVSCAGLLATLLASIITFCFYFDFESAPRLTHRITRNPILQIVKNEARTFLQSSHPIGFIEYFNQHLPLVVSVWLMGVALFTLRLLSGVSYIAYLKRYKNSPMLGDWQARVEYLSEQLGVNKAVEILESALVKTPMTIGALKPIILFPIGAVTYLSVEQMEAILAHELAHIRRNDYFLNILQSLVEIIFYFHPAVWWISNTIRNERENCCDDIAVSVSGNSLNYAKALVNLQELHAQNPMLAMGFSGKNSKNQLLNRVKRILNIPQNKSNIMEKLIATCFLLMVIAFSSFGEKKNEPLTSISEFSTNINKNIIIEKLENKNDTVPSVSDAQLLATLLKKLKKAHSVEGGNDFEGSKEFLKIDGEEITGREFELYKKYNAKSRSNDAHKTVVQLENEIALNIEKLNREIEKNKNGVYDSKMVDLQREISSSKLRLEDEKQRFYKDFERSLRLNDKVYLIDTFLIKSGNLTSNLTNEGEFVYNDHENSIVVTYLNGKIKQLIIKGNEIPKEDFNKYESFLSSKGISASGIFRKGREDSLFKKPVRNLNFNSEMFRHYLIQNQKLLADIQKKHLKGNLNIDSLFRKYNYNNFKYEYQIPFDSLMNNSLYNSLKNNYDEDTKEHIESLKSKVKSLNDLIQEKKYNAQFWDFYHDTNAALTIIKNKLSRNNLTKEDLNKIDERLHQLKSDIENKLKSN